MMPFNKRFTNRVTRSALEIRSPHFYARPSLRISWYGPSNPVIKSYVHPLEFIKITKSRIDGLTDLQLCIYCQSTKGGNYFCPDMQPITAHAKIGQKRLLVMKQKYSM